MKDIIIVEDGKQERERLEKLFRDAGYTVVACETVQQAENSIAHEEFRLAILDIGLHDKSGSLLFHSIRRSGRVAYAVIFTGNPSVHLKNRFMEEGAVDYIVKASPQAHNDAFLTRVKELIGAPQKLLHTGIDLETFLVKYVEEKSRQLFLEADNSFPKCVHCGQQRYQVVFSHQAQVPPAVNGMVVCVGCGKPMNPEVT